MKTLIMFIVLSWVALATSQVDRYINETEYVSPDKLVSLNANIEFRIAMDILSQYAVEFESKPIFDPTKQTGAIGIDVDRMHWERALQLILSRRGLWYEIKQHFLKVVVPQDKIRDTQATQVVGDFELSLGHREVQIETIFFEADRKAITEYGIDWSLFSDGKMKLTAEQFGALSIESPTFGGSAHLPKSQFGVDIDIVLAALDQKNVGKVIAQPQVVVTEGNEGKVQVGEDFSIKQRDFAGNVMDRFVSTGTILQVTPFVLEDKDGNHAILLNVSIERSQAFPDVTTTIIKKSEAKSFVQLFDSEETIIAGLYSTERKTLRTGVPFLKDLPLLKHFFGYNRYEDEERELIIVLKGTLLPDVFVRKEISKNRIFDSDDPDRLLKLYQKGNFDFSDTRKEKKELESKPTQATARKLYNAYEEEESKQKYTSAPVYKPPASSSAYQPKQSSTNSYSRTKNTYQKPVTVKKENPSANIRIGKITLVRNGMVVIKWFDDDFKAKRFDGQALPVMRKNSRGEHVYIGDVVTQKTQGSNTVAIPRSANAESLEIGDKVALRLQ